MPIDIHRAIRDVAAPLMGGYRQATKYLSPSLVVKGSRRHKPRRGERNVEIVLTVGKPNYAEREFITKCRKAGESFPVRKVQYKPWKESR